MSEDTEAFTALKRDMAEQDRQFAVVFAHLEALPGDLRIDIEPEWSERFERFAIRPSECSAWSRQLIRA
jgi:hypothetical protein